MRCPIVPRSLYDELSARYDALLEKYHTLKVAGATQRPTLAPVTPPPPSPEERIIAEAQADYEARVYEEMIADGQSPNDARAIAAQLRAALDTTLPLLS